MMRHKKIFTVLVILLLVAAQCGPPPAEQIDQTNPHQDELGTPGELSPILLSRDEKLKVMATTSIVGDVVKNIGGEMIDLTVLLPLGSDPHAFEPTPHDLVSVAEADVVFINGLGLEAFLAEMIKNAGSKAPVIAVSHGVDLRQIGEDEEHGHKSDEEEHHHEGVDPHTWMTPVNAIVFADNIEHALSALDPAHAEMYSVNAEAYAARLTELDSWVKEQIETIPTESRKLVSDHDTLGYYADHYGLEMVGTILPAYTTNAEPSAQELAVLQDAISQEDVKAVFVGITINPALAEQLAEDTGIKLVPLYTGSLGEPGSGAETYIDYIRFNTDAIVEALK